MSFHVRKEHQEGQISQDEKQQLSKRPAKAICQKKMETAKSKENQVVSKAESAGKAVSAKTKNFGQGRAQFPFW